ncbi:MAG: hypothetical protein ACI8PT_000753 [Gammaproteobacteria bacterium]
MNVYTTALGAVCLTSVLVSGLVLLAIFRSAALAEVAMAIEVVVLKNSDYSQFLRTAYGS